MYIERDRRCSVIALNKVNAVWKIAQNFKWGFSVLIVPKTSYSEPIKCETFFYNILMFIGHRKIFRRSNNWKKHNYELLVL